MLDRWVAFRKLEKQRRQAPLHSLDARFGDIHITAPTEGAWNQIPNNTSNKRLQAQGIVSENIQDTDAHRERSLPDSRVSEEYLNQDTGKRNFTITIPLPWTARKPRNREPLGAVRNGVGVVGTSDVTELSPKSTFSSPALTPDSFVSSPGSLPATPPVPHDGGCPAQAPSAVFTYKPISEEYKQDLAAMTRGISRGRCPARVHCQAKARHLSPVPAPQQQASQDSTKDRASSSKRLSSAILHQGGPLAACGEGGSLLGTRAFVSGPSPDLGPCSIKSGIPSVARPMPMKGQSERRISKTGLPPQPRLGSRRSTSPSAFGERSRADRLNILDATQARHETSRSCSRIAQPAMKVGQTGSSGRDIHAARTICFTDSSSDDDFSDSDSQEKSEDETADSITMTSSPSASTYSSTNSGNSNSHPHHQHHRSYSQYSLASSSSSSSSSGTIEKETAEVMIHHVVAQPAAVNKHTSAARNILEKASTTTTTNLQSSKPQGFYASVAQEYQLIATDIEGAEHERRRRRQLQDRELVPDKNADNLS